jgi:hypothetical protein
MKNHYNQDSKLNMRCSYCEESGHNIKNCEKDKHLAELLNQHPMPDFFKLPLKTCKRIASLIDIQTSLPRIRLATKFTKIWKENNVEPIIAEECAICMEKLKKTNVCTTACGHMFCLDCIFTVKERNNKCPLCRKPLSKKILPVSNPISSSNTPYQSPIPSSRARSPQQIPIRNFADTHDVYLRGLLDNENLQNEEILINRSLINDIDIELNEILINETIRNDQRFVESIVNNITTPTESITISVARNLDNEFIVT